FFRESHHFDYLRDQVLVPLGKRGPGQRLRIWSAGCSTGEEPYSIAMTIREALPEGGRHDIRILATDLDSEVLARARSGIYMQERVQGLSAERRSTFFREQREGNAVRHIVGAD